MYKNPWANKLSGVIEIEFLWQAFILAISS